MIAPETLISGACWCDDTWTASPIAVASHRLRREDGNRKLQGAVDALTIGSVMMPSARARFSGHITDRFSASMSIAFGSFSSASVAAARRGLGAASDAVSEEEDDGK